MAEPSISGALQIEIETAPNPRFTIIWLHGLGAAASDFTSIVSALGLSHTPPDVAAIRFIFPQAPHIPITMNGGYVSSAWYDIISADKMNRKIDESGLLATRERIRRLIQHETQRGIPTERIFMAGFSQGGAVAYFCALTHPETLAGIIALSTYLPSSNLLLEQATQANLGIPIFVAHGSQDDVVTPEFGNQAITTLQARGYHPQWKTYPTDHALCIREIRDVGRWLRTNTKLPD
jgi:phospholipase/carboxylesterase